MGQWRPSLMAGFDAGFFYCPRALMSLKGFMPPDFLTLSLYQYQIWQLYTKAA